MGEGTSDSAWKKKTKLKMFQLGSGSRSSHSGFLPRAKANAESVNIKKKIKEFLNEALCDVTKSTEVCFYLPFYDFCLNARWCHILALSCC